MKENIFATCHSSMAQSSTYDLSQHIPSPFVGRQYTIMYKEHRRTTVVSGNAERNVTVRFFAVIYSQQSARSFDNG